MLKRLFLVAFWCFAVVGGTSIFAQVGDYSFAVTSSTFTPITGGTDVNSIEADDALSSAIPLGFTFYMEGNAYTDIKVSSNGWASFGSPTSSITANNLDGAATSQRPVIAPLWDDLAGAASSSSQASYAVTGTSPNRVFTFEWLNWEWRYNATDSVVSFQIKLHETTNEIQFTYRWENHGGLNTPSASIGLTGAASWLSVGDINTGTPVASNTIEYSSIDSVVTDQVFTFTPPACSSPSFNTVSDIKTDSATVSFTSTGSGPFYINYGLTGFTQGASGSEYDTVMTSPFVLHGLQDGKTYDFYIQSDCGANGVSNWTGPNSFTTLPACPVPAFLSFTDVKTDSMTVNWTGNGSGPWYIYWGPTGFNQATPGVSLDTSATTSFIAYGLTGSTSYSFYIKEDCGGGDTSSYIGPFTQVTVFEPPYIETFTNGYPGADYTEAAGLLANPTTFTSTSSSAWKQDGFANSGTTGAVSINIYGTSRKEWFMGPSIDLGDGSTTYEYVMDVAVTNWNTTGTDAMGVDDTVAIVVSTDNGATWSKSNAIRKLTAADNIPNGSGMTVSASLAGYTGTVKIGVYAESTTSNADYDFHVDNIQVRIPPTCPAPSSLMSGAIGPDSIQVMWSSSASKVASGVEYGLTGFSPGTGMYIATTDTFAVARSLTPNVEYDFYVYDTCGTGYSTPIGPITVRTSCLAQSIPFVEGFNSTSITKGCWTVIDANSDGDAWNLSYTSNPLNGDQVAMMYTDFNSGANDDWLISPTIALSANEQLIYYYRVQSSGEPNDFEVLISTTGTSPASFTTTLLPLASYSNTTYMKQTIDVSGYSGNANIAWHVPPGGLDGWRIYIDSVVVEQLPPCADPTVLTATNLQPYQATLGWTQPNGTSWNIEWGPQGFLQGSGVGNMVNGVSNPYVLTSLGPDSCYDFYVQQACGSSGTSGWVGPYTFCTTPTCPPPSNLGVDPASVGTTTADIYWTPAFNGNYFNIEYGPLGFARGTGTAMNASNDTVSLTSLSASTCYEFYVRDSCGVGDVSTWVGPYSFSTNGGVLTLPVSEGFENGFTYFKNNCTNTINWVDQQTVVKAGSNAGRVAYQTNDAIVLELSGIVDLSSTTNPTLSFWHIAALEGGFDDAYVEISTDGGFTYVALPASSYLGSAGSYTSDLLFDEDDYPIWGTSTAPAQNSWWQFEAFDLSAFKADSVRVRFRLTSDGSVTRDGWYLDDVKIEDVSCAMPTSLGFVSATLGPDSAEVYWTSGGASYANVEYGPTGYTPGTGTMVSAANDTVVISGLSSSTCYDVYVRDSCGVGDVSNWNGPIAFCTACTPFAAPYYENFNANGWVADNSGSAPNSVIGLCWDRNPDNGTSYSWRVRSVATASSPTGPNQDYSGNGNFVYSEASSGTSGNVAELISPEVDLTGTTAPILTYAYHFFGSQINKMYVDINSGSGWTVADSIVGQQQTSSSAAWLMDTVDLSTYIGSTVSVRFRAISAGCCTGDMAIDEFYVGDPATCLRPTALAAGSATATTIDVSWTTGGASNWNIEYGPIGFTLGNGTRVTNVSSNPYTINNLSAYTCYEYYVRDSCSASSVSLWAGPFAFTTSGGSLTFPITEDFENGFTYFENNCRNATLWGLQQTIVNGGSNAAKLAYQTNDTSMLELKGTIDLSNTTAPVLMFSHIAALEGGFDEGHVQISTDGGQTYVDLPASAYIGSAAGYTSNLYFEEDDYSIWGTFTAPAQNSWWQSEIFDLSAYKTANVRVRFRIDSDGSIQRDGWYLDDVQIIEMPCLSPSNVAVNVVGCDTVSVSWTSEAATTSSYIEYGAKGFTPGSGTVVPNVSSAYQLTGLSLNTEYDLYVVDSCGMDQSNPSQVVTFKTDSVGPIMASFTYTQVSTTANDADVDFDASASLGDGLSYAWDFDNGNTGSGVNSSANYTGNGTYNVTLTVTDRCGNTDDTTVVITVAGISIVENVYNAGIEMYPNPNNGTFKVNVSAGKGNYTIQVTELSGKVIYTKTDLTPGNAELIELNNVADGVYMVRLIGEGLNVTQRILID